MTTYLEELFIRFTTSAFRKLPSIYVFSYFPFGFEGRMWDLIVSVPDHCLSFYLASTGLAALHPFIQWPQCIDSGYLVSATPHTILYQSF